MMVTVSKARELDRAMVALHKGHISYGRWVEVLRDWVAGEDVTRLEFPCDSVPDRIWTQFRGQAIRNKQVVDALDVKEATACAALSRMCKRGLAEKVSHGMYRIGGRGAVERKGSP